MSHTEDTTTIKVGEEPVNSYKLYPRNEEFAKRAGGNTGSVPKPLTYDYMPDGYPSKTVQTTTLMEEQELEFAPTGSAGQYGAQLTEALDIVEGQTYTVNWDGTEYECVCSVFRSIPTLGNLSIMNAGDDTGEPFVYMKGNGGSVGSAFGTLDTSASHTISVKRIEKTVTPMAEEFFPATALIAFDPNAGTLSSDLAYDELYARLLDGKQVVLHDVSKNEYLYLTKWNKQSSGRIDLFFNGERNSISLLTDGTIGPTPVA